MYDKDKDDCPRGFHFCEKKQECVPDGTQVADRLEQRYQRFFFKESYELDDVDKLVDEVFAGGFHTFKKRKKIENLVDAVINKTIPAGRPYDHPLKMKVTPTLDGKTEVDVDECSGPLMDNKSDEFQGSGVDDGEKAAKEENPEKVSNDINHVPNQNVHGLKKSIYGELGESWIWKAISKSKKQNAYKRFIKKAMVEHNYSSIDDIPEEDRVNFFNAVNRSWMTAREQMMIKAKGQNKEKRHGGFGRIAGAVARGGLGRIAGTKKRGGFGTIAGRPQEDEDQSGDVDKIEDDTNEE